VKTMKTNDVASAIDPPTVSATTRICRICGIEKPIEEFKNRFTCTKCKNELARSHYKEHKDELNALRRKRKEEKRRKEGHIEVCLRCPLEKCVEEYDKPVLDLSTISRSEVAYNVHCVPEHISQIFLGKTVCSLALAYDIAHYLGVTLDDFYRAITGANGKNPARRYRYTGRVLTPPKYSVEGKGYPNLREALKALGQVRYVATHYNELPDEVKARIIRNRACRGR